MTREEALNKAINIVRYFEAHFAKSKEARENAANIIEALEQEHCEDAVSPTAEPVGFEEAKKLIYQEWKSKVAKDNPNPRLLVAYQIAMKALEQEPKMEQFAKWVASEIFDDNWEYNKDAFDELACRKLAKLGIVRATGDEWELVEPQESEEQE